MERISYSLVTPGSTRAFTLTGVYGTGKSAGAHFFCALCAPRNQEIQKEAFRITKRDGIPNKTFLDRIQREFPQKGFIRAVATGQRESLSVTVLRALSRGMQLFWAEAGRKPDAYRTVEQLLTQAQKGKIPDSSKVLEAVVCLAESSKTGLFLVIDELGKNLEHVVANHLTEDLYLLQQLAELPSGPRDPIVTVVGILHQSFAEYGQNLTAAHRTEWGKIQGRFEDISFADSPEQMLRLIGHAIDHGKATKLGEKVTSWAVSWSNALSEFLPKAALARETLNSIYPLHPLTAYSLPTLSAKLAQNDRSLFTFLTSQEPLAFSSFLAVTEADLDKLPTLKLDHLFDYFVQSVGVGLSSRPQLQRWLEIQHRITESSNLPAEQLSILKVVGLLNLLSSTGSVRARRDLIVLALCNKANDKTEKNRWTAHLDELIKRGLVTYRKQADEVRLWEGSDFDVDSAVLKISEAEYGSLAASLERVCPAPPIVAQRHSYEKGTLRYFECRYLDDQILLDQIETGHLETDGIIVYWVGEKPPGKIPAFTPDKKPIIILISQNSSKLRMACTELSALSKIERETPQLQTDGVARREVRERLSHAQKVVEDLISDTFTSDFSRTKCIFLGETKNISGLRALNRELSTVCDLVYDKGLILKNEILNRRDVTSQGAKARRVLLEAMVSQGDKELLGLEGNGPEHSMYFSLLHKYHLHVDSPNGFGFRAPTNDGILPAWNAIDEFFKSSAEQPKTLREIYIKLAKPPFGLKEGPIPVLLGAQLILHQDDVSLFKDGTLIPVLGGEHFELLVKNPDRFTVKFINLMGVRQSVFDDLQDIVQPVLQGKERPQLRNKSLLGLVKPLVMFARNLPEHTQKTKSLSIRSRDVLRVLSEASDPEQMIFSRLPEACDLVPFKVFPTDDDISQAKLFKERLVQALQEIGSKYDTLLSQCEQKLRDAFALGTTDFRVELAVRSKPLFNNSVGRLKSFVGAVINESSDQRAWLESVLMIVGDKPVRTWTDENIALFEIQLADLARQFQNMENLCRQLLMVPAEAGAMARMISIMRPGRTEINTTVFVNEKDLIKVQSLVEEITSTFLDKVDPYLRRAILAELLEKLLAEQAQADKKEGTYGR